MLNGNPRLLRVDGRLKKHMRKVSYPDASLLLELHVPDFDRVEPFYGLFGFSFVRSEPDYLVLERSGCVIHFYGGSEQVVRHSYFGRFPKDSPRGYGVEIILFCDDIETLFERVRGEVEVEVVSGLQLRPWGVKDFRVADPFGYYLRISEPYDTRTFGAEN